MELSFPLAVGAGRLASASLIGRHPGIAMFAAGLLAGALAVALASWLRSMAPIPQVPDISAHLPLVAVSPDAEPQAIAPLPHAHSEPPPAGLPYRSAELNSGADAVRQVERARPGTRQMLRIGVLGTLTINGQAGALLPAQSQLIVALALHPGGLSNSRLRTLLGADAGHPKPADSLRQLIARTRRALGKAGDKREWIEHQGHGHYALHPDAWVDWREFGTLTTTGGSGGSSPLASTNRLEGASCVPLTEALSLIRGQPFTGCYYWWLEPELVDSVTARIVAAAEALANLRLAAQDPAAAVRAARIGLAADSSAEQLWRVLMRAEHAAGNLAGVRGAWGRCLDVVSEVAADGQPDSATSAVYTELLAR
jgi:DNA-binding SARP family transcriptional activator